MKLSAQEEYGLRCLLRVARGEGAGCQTIPQISTAEGLTTHHVAKLMRILRRGGFVRSTRGQAGGYTLSRPSDQITVLQVLNSLGGPVFSPRFCERHTGTTHVCANYRSCNIRCLWKTIQYFLDELLGKTTISDLLTEENELLTKLDGRTQRIFQAQDIAALPESIKHVDGAISGMDNKYTVS
ncbi:MAG: Rrf2 family transcriptional regulator [Bryobacterales bacterium]|jgi:Rrf2 family protein|nr:Rrf2 family transcriptional regulator [Bryobacterales bacterium]